MMTLVLALIHGFSTNPNFKPVDLYVGTFILDYVFIVSVFHS